MCRLKIKLKIIGKKNQEFTRFILVPKNRRQKSKYLFTFGHWDTRKNRNTRHVDFCMYYLMFFYSFGCTFNKGSLHHLFVFCIAKAAQSYFEITEMMLFLENKLRNTFNLKNRFKNFIKLQL